MGVDISYLTVSAHDPFSVCKYIFDAKKTTTTFPKVRLIKNKTKFMKEKSRMYAQKNTSRKKKEC